MFYVFYVRHHRRASLNAVRQGTPKGKKESSDALAIFKADMLLIQKRIDLLGNISFRTRIRKQ